jgi:RecA-family ATPase
VGKSKLAMQLSVATAAEVDWLCMTPAYGPVLYIGAEDDIPEFHRRFQEIADSYGIRLDQLKHLLVLIPMADRDAVMAATAKAGRIATTPNWRGVEAMVVQHKPCLVVFDSLADVYAGNEINRSEARQFIALLRGLAIRHDLTAVLLSHPSVAGIQSGSGTSGSTAWSNSVRSRLALERLKDDGGKEIEPNKRVLKIMRSNYGPADRVLRLRWSSGVWELEGSTQRATSTRPSPRPDAKRCSST